jgi:hypothetical protein
LGVGSSSGRGEGSKKTPRSCQKHFTTKKTKKCLERHPKSLFPEIRFIALLGASVHGKLKKTIQNMSSKKELN